MVSRMLNQSVVESDEPLEITISGGERAPNLRRYLESQGVRLHAEALSEAGARAARARRTGAVVLLVPPDYAALFQAARPAPLLLIADSSDSQTRKSAERLRALLAGYGSGIAQLRIADPRCRSAARRAGRGQRHRRDDAGRPRRRGAGIHDVFRAVFRIDGRLVPRDRLRPRASASADRSKPLLSLPVARGALVGGKILATCAYMCLSLAINLAAFVCVFRFVPLERLGMSANLGVAHGARVLRDLLAVRAAGRRPDDVRGLLHAQLPRSADLSHQRALGADAADRLREHLFAQDQELADAHSLLEPALLMTSVLKDEPIAPARRPGIRRVVRCCSPSYCSY